MHFRFILIFTLILPCFLTAQLEENFDGINISDLTNWSGDLDDFIVNDDGQLQLFALEKGVSQIYTPITLTESTEWQFDFILDFAPSSSNQLRVYLFADTEDLPESSGYFLEIGESGSDDNLKFFRQKGGEEELLGEGTMSSVGFDPAEAKVKVIRSNNGIWSFFASYDGNQFVQLEFEVAESEIEISNGYFGLFCKYSETRKDKFFFDNIYAGDVLVDTKPPELVSAVFLDLTKVRLVFNELVSISSALNVSTYFMDIDIGNPIEASFGEFENEVIIEFNTTAIEGTIYQLSINNIEDLSGNKITIDKILFVTSAITVGDIVINEILFDPYPGGEDFVELYNKSGKYLDLSGLILYNSDNERSAVVNANIILSPAQYLAITSDLEALSKEYMLLIPENVIEHQLPAWNNARGNVSLLLEGLEVPIDSYDYDEDDHSQWIDDTEGVSLERVNPQVETNIESNWQSATEQSGYATPGYKNSNFSAEIIDETVFSLEKKTFSPDGDGFDDILEIKYRVSTAGFVLNMRVFDDRGHLVNTLTTNEILGQEGSVIWDGTTDEGTIGKMGIYVIWLEYFNTEGSIAHKKLSCVLAKQLN